MEFLQDLFSLIGRVLISATFLWGAYYKITHWHATVGRMKAKNVPHVNIVLPVGIGLKIVGGLMVFFGWYAHFGALLLLIVAVPSLLWMHMWWKKHGEDREVERRFFFKEIAVIGGLFMILALGAGHFAL